MLTVGIVLSVTLAGFEALGVSAAMPRVASDLGGRRLYGIAIGAFMLGQLATIPVAGAMADRNRPRLAYALGLASFAGGLVLAAVAPSMVIVVVARTVAGLGAGALSAVNFATIGRAYPEAIRSRMFAVVSSAWVIPGAVGPAASGWVADHLGWRWVFAGLLPLFPVIGWFEEERRA